MSERKALDFIATFLAFVILIIGLGAIFPEYFGPAAEIITQNLGNFTIIVVLAIIIYILTQAKRR